MASQPTQLLFKAIRDKSLAQVDAHLTAGADIEALEDDDEHTPLTLAVGLGHVQVVQRLLDRGARVNALNGYGYSALAEATGHGQLDITKLILDHGADLEQQVARGEPWGGTVLLLALANARHDVATWLLDHGARADVVSVVGETALFRAALVAYPNLGRLLECPGVLELVDAACGARSETALHVAARENRVDHVRQLLAAGACTCVTDKDGRRPLHWACYASRVPVIRALLRHGADVSAVDVNGDTPLLIMTGMAAGPTTVFKTSASMRDLVHASKLLLDYGADRATRARSGETARDRAVRTGLPREVVDVLDTYFPITPQVAQVLLGMRGPTESSLTRFASHELYEPRVLSLVKCLLTGEEDVVFEQLQCDASE